MNSGFSCKSETLTQCCPLLLDSYTDNPLNQLILSPHAPSPHKGKTGLPLDFPFQVDGTGRYCAQVWKIEGGLPCPHADWLGPALVWCDTQVAPPRAELRRVNAQGDCWLVPKQPPWTTSQEPPQSSKSHQQRGLALASHPWGQRVQRLPFRWGAWLPGALVS